MNNPSDLAVIEFGNVALAASVFELRLRLLGGKYPKTNELPIDVKLSILRDALIPLHELTDSDKTLLNHACVLRNKILHCEFSTAREKLNVSNPKTRSGKVFSFHIASATGTPVSETKTRKLKDVFGWLLEALSAGEFTEALEVFNQAIALVDKMAWQDCGELYGQQ